MTVQFTRMSEDDFCSFVETAAVDYAEDKVKNGTWRQETALEQSKAAFRTLLPDGIRTKDHYLNHIVAGERKIGYLWYHIDRKEEPNYAFLYDIVVFEEARGQGFGTAALELFIREAKAQGIEDIWLHVFGHNERALKLYQKIGFEIKDYTLKLSR